MPEVYQVTNMLTGGRYIGATRKTVTSRRYTHSDRAQRGETGCRLFWAALREYGKKHFRWEVLAVFERYADALAEEKRLIKETQPEYNVEYRCKDISPERRKELAILGRQNIERWRQYSHLGPQASSRKVICVDQNTTHESASAAARAYGVAKSAVIELCLGQRGRKTVGGHVFKYEDSL